MMRRPRGLAVVKLGGSHAFSPHLKDWLGALARCAGHVVVVPGGKPFSDTVRAAQPGIGFDDRAAHHMALLAMEQYGCALTSLHQGYVLADSLTAICRAARDGRVPVWCPARMTLPATDIAWSWDVTSDSLAAWLARRLGAARLMLVKHAAPHVSLDADGLAAQGIVDAAFPTMLGAVPACIVGAADHAEAAEAIRRGLLAGTPVVRHRRPADRARATDPRCGGEQATK
jgi:5-(aminomethyl)-3-furanmethanol phosphate kinase